MTQITGGKIVYSQQKEPGVFGSPKAEVTFDFGVAEGDSYEATAKKAANEAKTFVLKLIGLAKADAAPTTADAAPVNDKEKLAAAVIEANTPTKEAKPRGRPKNPTTVSAPPATDAGSAADIAGANDIGGGDDDGEDNGLGGFGLEAEVAATPISDEELNAAAQAKFKVLKDGAKIRAVAVKYIPNGKGPTWANVPQEHRAKVIAEINALT
jgi:hypothetical protein